MKILNQPDYHTWIYEFTCIRCATQLCADHTDLKYRVEKQFYQDEWDEIRGGYYSDKDYYYLTCPVCQTQKQVHSNQKPEIPYLLQQKLKEEYRESAQTTRK